MLTPYAQVTKLLEQMSAATSDPEAMGRLSDQISVLARAYLPSDKPSFLDNLEALSGKWLQFSPSQARILNCLYAQKGKIVCRERLMDALYYDKSEEPSGNTVAVMICQIRKKLLGTKYEIENIHSQGFRLVEKL